MPLESINQRLSPVLSTKKSQHLYRVRPIVSSPQDTQMQINNIDIINFSSNDYLGLANHPELQQTAQDFQNMSYGSGAAHLVTGHHQNHHLLEEKIASWLRVESTLLFSTGYIANISVLQTLMQKGDLILADKLCHASLIDGALNSKAEFKRYPHLDMQALEKKLIQAQQLEKQVLIVSDGVFSMDGDIAPLKQIQLLAIKYQAWLYIDDAHGFGTLGQNGKGSFEHFGLRPDNNTIVMGTLGKAFGCSGAFIAASTTVIETLIQLARPYIYTTAMPAINAKVCLKALQLVKTAQAERRQLQTNIQQFREGINKLSLNLLPSKTAIQAIILQDSETAVSWSEQLKELGFWVTAIRPPTVPKNTARLRVTLSSSHTSQQIKKLLTAIQTLC
jgi:8-amino-7-oxononanoate synthase